MRIRLEEGQFGTYEIVPVLDEGRDWVGKPPESILVQVDYDRCGIASTFGWSPCYDCRRACKRETDGTVDCARRTVSEHIASATDYLDVHIGDTVDDPGYFG